jgi:hypothetical protein
VTVTLLLSFALAAPPAEGPPAPRFERGREYAFVGEIVDSSDRPGLKYKNVYDLTVRWFVLDATDDRADLAVLTAVTPRADKAIAAAVRTVSGETTSNGRAAARVDFVRVTNTGLAKRLVVPATPPPYAFPPDHPTEPLPDEPTDGPAFAEFGLFPPTAPGTDPSGRVWSRLPDDLWNGGRAIDLVGVRASKGYDDLNAAVAGWRRTERLYVSPVDGLPRAYARRVEQREGKNVVQTVETRLDAKAPTPAADAAKVRHVRREAETAAWLAAEADVLRGSRTDPKLTAAFKARVVRFLAEHQPPTSFRPAVEAFAGP